MSQREKIAKAHQMANRVLGVARALRIDAATYDCRFPVEHAERLEHIANEYLKLK